MLMRKNWTLLLLLFGLACMTESCTSSRSYSHDYTANRSARSKSKVKRPVNKSKRTVAARPKVSTPKKSTSSTASTRSKTSNRTSAIKLELTERNRIVDFASKYKGLKYQYGGKTPESGFDCSGLIYYTFRHHDYSVPPNSAAQSKEGRRINLAETRAGDLVFFGRSGKVNHVAMVTHNNGKQLMILHSTSSGGVIEEDLNRSSYWKGRYLFAKNYLGQSGSSSLARNP